MPYMFLNGGGMRGGSLHHLLAGAPLVAETRTAPHYLLYSVGDRYPALQPCSPDAGLGAAIVGEVYDLSLDLLRDDLLPAEPPELELGVIELADGSSALGMILRRACPALDHLTDITAYGGWRAYLSRHRSLGRRACRSDPSAGDEDHALRLEAKATERDGRDPSGVHVQLA